MQTSGRLSAVLLGVVLSAGADRPPTRLQVVSPRDDGIIATGINGRGEVVGFEWVEEKERPGVIAQAPFFAVGKKVTYLPLLPGYTATFPAAVSDGGLVVGRASKPAPPGVNVHMRNQAFVWDARGGIRGLGALPDDTASFATGVSRDGRCVGGFSVGNNRVRACVWERDGDAWKGTPLPQEHRLGSNTVALSGDGRHAAAVDGVLPCLWTRGETGAWARRVIAEPGALVPRGVNDEGTVVGLRNSGDGRTHAALWEREGGYKPIAEPEGYERSEANAVNNAGVVVGMVDGRAGSKVGPRAFAYEGGRLRLIDEAGPAFASATAVNDRGQVAGVFEKDEEPEPAPGAGEKKKVNEKGSAPPPPNPAWP